MTQQECQKRWLHIHNNIKYEDLINDENNKIKVKELIDQLPNQRKKQDFLKINDHDKEQASFISIIDGKSQKPSNFNILNNKVRKDRNELEDQFFRSIDQIRMENNDEPENNFYIFKPKIQKNRIKIQREQLDSWSAQIYDRNRIEMDEQKEEVIIDENEEDNENDIRYKFEEGQISQQFEFQQQIMKDNEPEFYIKEKQQTKDQQIQKKEDDQEVEILEPNIMDIFQKHNPDYELILNDFDQFEQNMKVRDKSNKDLDFIQQLEQELHEGEFDQRLRQYQEIQRNLKIVAQQEKEKEEREERERQQKEEEERKEIDIRSVGSEGDSYDEQEDFLTIQKSIMQKSNKH